MFCNYCGAQIPDSSKFCTSCGRTLEQPTSTPNGPTPPPARPVTPPPPPPITVAPKQPGEDYAMISMILGIIALFTCGNILGVIAIVLGNMAKKEGYAGQNANIGIACGWGSVGMMALAILVYVVYFVFIMGITALSF